VQRTSLVIVAPGLGPYVYGDGDSECTTLPSLRLMLDVVAPSAGDLVDFAITVTLLMLCVQPCLVCSGLASVEFNLNF